MEFEIVCTPEWCKAARRTTQHIGAAKGKNGVDEKNDDCYAITARAAKEEREPARQM